MLSIQEHMLNHCMQKENGELSSFDYAAFR